jgi:hypothetical protein
MCHTALMLLIFITFCVLNSIMSYDQSKRVTKVGAFDCRWAFCGEPKFSFNPDRRSTSYFKIFFGSQKVNSFPCGGLGVVRDGDLDVMRGHKGASVARRDSLED